MAQPHPVYHRKHPSPSGQRGVGWLILCWMLIIFSPFAGFALHGKVDERGLVLGLWFALLPIAGLMALAWVRRADRRRVPPEMLSEWRDGLLIPAAGAPPVTSPWRYAGKHHWIELRADGVLVSRSALLNLGGLGDFREEIAATRTADAAGQHFVPWTAIDTWEVTTDSDGPNFHRLLLRPRGQVRIRRFRPGTGHEADLLDGVRAIGQVPVRLFDDLTVP